MPPFTTRPELLGTFGMVASTHWLASAAGMAVLEQGGNAFDAAVATGFTLQVVEPHLNGPGGEVPILLARAGGTPRVICGQGVAPRAATVDAYHQLGLTVVPGNGLLAAVVPGAFDAWMLLLKRYGKMRLRVVLETAIGYARDGFPVVPNISATIASVKGLFTSAWPTSAAVFLPDGAPPAPGTLLRNPALAEVYARLIGQAEDASRDRDGQIEAARHIWRTGFVAQAMVEFCQSHKVLDTSGECHSGLLCAEDLASWQATEEASLSYDYKGYQVHKTGPWGQGPVFLQQLALLEGFDLDRLDETSPEFVHLVTEAAKLALADREAFYGDPDFVRVPLDVLLSRDYNAARRQLIDPRAASHQLRPGTIPGHGGKVVIRPAGDNAAAVPDYLIGEPTVARFDNDLPGDKGTQGDTCHLDIIDRWGNMVAATPSGGWLQSSPVIPELGFPLTNRAQMFWLDPETPSCIAPGKRPRTTLTPSLALRQGKPYMVFGTPGGDQQDQWSLQFFLRHVHFGLNLQQAIDAPAFTTQHLVNSFYPREIEFGHLAIEGRFPAATAEALCARGHKLVIEDDWSLGRMSAVCQDGDILKAGANARGMQGYAVGR